MSRRPCFCLIPLQFTSTSNLNPPRQSFLRVSLGTAETLKTLEHILPISRTYCKKQGLSGPTARFCCCHSVSSSWLSMVNGANLYVDYRTRCGEFTTSFNRSTRAQWALNCFYICKYQVDGTDTSNVRAVHRGYNMYVLQPCHAVRSRFEKAKSFGSAGQVKPQTDPNVTLTNTHTVKFARNLAQLKNYVILGFTFRLSN